MALEFLQADGDIPEFVDYLYERGYALAHRCGPRRGIVLCRQDAIYALQDDLHTAWGTYVIGTPSRQQLLYLDSCGPQAHPSQLGRQGRFAGRIAFSAEKDPEAQQLMRLLRNYFRRTCAFQRYNGEARMSCHFGPHYQKEEAAFFADPRAEALCTGFLQVFYSPGQEDAEAAARLLDRPEICNARISVRPYWADHSLVQLHVPFLYDAERLDLAVGAALLAKLGGAGSSVRVRRESRCIEMTNRDCAQAQAGYAQLLLTRPWIPFG